MRMDIITSENLKVHPRMKELYKFFKFNGKVTDITDYDRETLEVFSREVLKMINEGKPGWEPMSGIAEIIRSTTYLVMIQTKCLKKLIKKKIETKYQF
jgi:hypothetical protein